MVAYYDSIYHILTTGQTANARLREMGQQKDRVLQYRNADLQLKDAQNVKLQEQLHQLQVSMRHL